MSSETLTQKKETPRLVLSTFNVLFDQLIPEDQEAFLNGLPEIQTMKNEIEELLKEGEILRVYCTVCKTYKYKNINRDSYEIDFLDHRFNEDAYDEQYYGFMKSCGISNTGNNSIGLCLDCYELDDRNLIT